MAPFISLLYYHNKLYSYNIDTYHTVVLEEYLFKSGYHKVCTSP